MASPTLVSGFPVSNSAATLSLPNKTVGDVVVLLIVDFTQTTTTFTTPTGGNVTTWNTITTGSDATAVLSYGAWWGTVTTAATATVTFGNNHSGGNFEPIAYSFTTTGPSWNIESYSTVHLAAGSSSITGPSLTPTYSTDVYCGYAMENAGDENAGSTSGFTYTATAVGNIMAYDNSLTSGTAANPNWLSNNSSGEQWAFGCLVSMTATAATPKRQIFRSNVAVMRAATR